MRYGRIVTFKIASNSLSDLKAYISGLKGYADGNAIINRINVEYVTEEPCVERRDEE
tara:strand:- start:392 stop:562 length:171 start_codon:yes stop_codon:yes gene_type:complete